MQLNKLTLLGMSGVGKTHLAAILSKENQWFHYSGDYRIGSKYLNNIILQNIKKHMQTDNYLAKLMANNSINIINNININNLTAVANFLGKIGNPNIGGLPLSEFTYRQNLHLEAEKLAMLDVEKFIKKAKLTGIDRFINDAGGSLCELDDNTIYQKLADNTLIIYIQAGQTTKKQLIKRAQLKPKPIYYNANFLKQQLEIYKNKHHLDYVAQINPDEFVRYIFPYLVKYRIPKYQNIANKFGITINADDMYQCDNTNDFFDLVKQQCR